MKYVIKGVIFLSNLILWGVAFFAPPTWFTRKPSGQSQSLPPQEVRLKRTINAADEAAFALIFLAGMAGLAFVLFWLF